MLNMEMSYSFTFLLKNIMHVMYIHTGTYRMASDPTNVMPEIASKQGGIRQGDLNML
jgi:hypothetical protein